MILLSLQGLVSESDASQLHSLIVATLALNMLLISLDMLHCEGRPSTGTGCPERLWSLHLGDIQKPSGQRPEQLPLDGPD